MPGQDGLAGDVTPNENPTVVSDEFNEAAMEDSVRRISDWVDKIARADGGLAPSTPCTPSSRTHG